VYAVVFNLTIGRISKSVMEHWYPKWQ